MVNNMIGDYMYVLIIILLAVFFVFFIPIDIYIKIKTKDFKEETEKDYIEIRICKIKTFRYEFKESINYMGKNNDKVIDYEKLLEYLYKNALKAEKGITKYIPLDDIYKIIDKLKFKRFVFIYGVNTQDYVANTYINTFITTLVNVLLGRNIEKFKKSYVNIKYIHTEYNYSYQIECIITTKIAKNIFVVKNFLMNKVKERWNLKWQSIQ